MNPTDPEIGATVSVNGIATNYIEAGTGSTVLLLHGSGPGVTAYANWRLVIPSLAAHFRVVAPDIVGFGYTDRPATAQYSLDYWVRHIAGFIAALSLKQVAIVGNSFGGALALALATRHPHFVTRMALMGSVGVEFPLTPGLDAVWGYEPTRERMSDLLHIFAYDHRIISAELIESRFRASARPGYQESFVTMFPAPRQQGIAALATPQAEIRRIDKPTLLVHGRDDRVIPTETSLTLNSLIATSQLHLFNRCGHWVQIEQTRAFCALVGSFLQGALDQ
jgi:pimeloyl-ACP methyl ester carboxylesterase